MGKPEVADQTRCTENYEGLRERIYKGLLPAQKEFCDDREHLLAIYDEMPVGKAGDGMSSHSDASDDIGISANKMSTDKTKKDEAPVKVRNKFIDISNISYIMHGI